MPSLGSNLGYIYDPRDGDLSVWVRGMGDATDGENRLRAVNYQDEVVSPRMSVRFAPRLNREMVIFYPSGQRFLTVDEMDDAREHAEAERVRAEAERERAEAERDSAVARVERLAARLLALGVDPVGV